MRGILSCSRRSTLAQPVRQRLDAYTQCSYNYAVRFTWQEVKRKQNLKDHGLDFADAREVFEGATYTFEDDRFQYEERRL